jgi:hypothetical protein
MFQGIVLDKTFARSRLDRPTGECDLIIVKPRAIIEVESVAMTDDYLRSRHTYIAFSSSAGGA